MIDFNKKSLRFNEVQKEKIRAKNNNSSKMETDRNSIAIIGVGIHLPNVKDIDEFWDSILAGVDFTKELQEERKESIDKYLKLKQAGSQEQEYYRGSYVDGIDEFDHSFFRMSPKEAQLSSPVHRIFLQTAIHAIEDAGYGGDSLKGSNTGIYFGLTSDYEIYKYKEMIKEINPELLSMAGVANLSGIVPARLSHLNDLKGPCLVIDTACASSLTSLDMACKAIRNKTVDTAIVGSARTNIMPLDQEYMKVGIESSDGLTRTFDHDADGSGLGEGAVVILLKSLDEAQKDGDNIYAIIKGSAVNNDGSSMGITAPNPDSQKQVILNAWKDANIDPETLTFVEAHGTGTSLGDPIEVEGLTNAFKKYTDRKQFCALGSSKSNIGHLFECSGLVGVVKCIMAMKHKIIPPTIHFSRPNVKLNLVESPLYINTRAKRWEAADNYSRRCAVSSFGISGTNCHAVLEEPPVTEGAKEQRTEWNLLVLSAKSEKALSHLLEAYYKLLSEKEEPAIGAICHTANTGRAHLECRYAIIAKDRNDLLKKITLIRENAVSEAENEWFYYKLTQGNSDKTTSHTLFQPSGDISTIKNIKELQNIAELYINGVQIEWNTLYPKEIYKKTRLPVYPFEPHYCWPYIPAMDVMGENDFKGLYHSMTFKQSKEIKLKTTIKRSKILVLNNGSFQSEALITYLRKNNHEITEVKQGNAYQAFQTNQYYITAKEEDCLKLIQDIKEIRFDKVIDLFSLTDQREEESLDKLRHRIDYGVNSAFYLIREMIHYGMDKNLDFVMIGTHVHEVTGEEPYLNPDAAALCGFGKVLLREYPGIRSRFIDMDHVTDVGTIINEIFSDGINYLTAYRKEKRYYEELDILSMEKVKDSPVEFVENGVYIIAGGAGGIGQEIAKYIASKNKVIIAFINRKRLPKRESWSAISGDSFADEGVRSRINGFIEIEALGSVVEYFSAELSSYVEVSTVIDTLKLKYGKINGVINAAGVIHDKFIATKKTSDFHEVLNPKVYGTWILDHLTRSERLDFFVLFSSGNTILGEPGQGDYVAANAYMDAYAAYRNKYYGKTIAINWPNWIDTGMAKNTVDTAYKRISITNGITAFETILNKDMTRVFVGEVNYGSEILDQFIESAVISLSDNLKSSLKLKSVKATGDTVIQQTTSVEQVRLIGRTSNTYTYYETEVATILNKILGYSEFNIDDNIFELGADSISLMKVISEIYTRLGIRISYNTFFERVNIKKLADTIESEMRKENGQSDLVEESSYDNTDEDEFTLTEVQMAYLLGRNENYELGGTSTHTYLELETKADMKRLTNAAQKMIRKHPMLRAIILKNGMQKILKEVPDYEIKITDVSHLNKKEQEEMILIERGKKSHQIFHTEQWPLFEFSAFKLDQERHYLFFSYDLLICDSASIQIMGKDLMEYYREPELEVMESDYSFRDYIEDYLKFKKSDIYDRDKEYWLNKLSEFPPAPAVPFKNDPAGIKKPRFECLRGEISSIEWDKIKIRAKEHNITPSVVLCTAYALVLGFWSSQRQMVINLAAFNRNPFNEDVEQMIGDFTAITLLEIDLGIGNSFWETAKEVQGNLFNALEHRNYDGIEMIAEISNKKSLRRKAVMPIVFTSLLATNPLGAWGELGEIKYNINQTSQVYIDNRVFERDGNLVLNWDHIQGLFDLDVISHMFEQYIQIIRYAAEQDNFYELKISSKENQLIQAYNRTEELIAPNTLHRLFESQAEKTPENIAVVFESQSITYRELDEKSNQVAGFLHERGANRNELIGLLTHRSIETIINMIGIVKAGAAYIPLDPEYPEDRIKYMMEQGNSKTLLNPQSYIENGIHRYSIERKANTYNTDDLAYVIYTSGSTGRPKGVAITHRAVTNTIIDINQKFKVTKSDRIIGLSSMCFDLSVYDIWGALSSGASLVLVKDQRDVNNLVEVLDREQITIWNSVPAIMGLLSDNVEEGYRNKDLRLVMLSGDWIPMSQPGKIKKHFPESLIVSLGGATEASIWSIYHPITELSDDWTSIPYGRPLANQKMYILNRDQELCSIGVSGEIYIGGVGVAKGYYNDDQKSRASFIMHPEFGYLYRTGDYGILHEDEYIEFLGRRDQQVKIRGYRIEIGEIENTLETYEDVNKCAVLLHKEDNGIQYLCAFYTSENPIESNRLSNYLKKKLPDYMIPQSFQWAAELPLTSNGKVDRNELEQLIDLQPVKSDHVGARNEIEKAVVKICEDVLNVKKLGITDNFFEYGLNSIIMVQIATRIGRELKIGISLQDFITVNNISELTDLMNQSNPELNEIVIYEQKNSDFNNVHKPFPLTEVQSAYLMGRNNAFELGGTSTHGFIEFESHLDPEKLNIALQKLIKRHPMLRTVFHNDQQQILESIPTYDIRILDVKHMGKEEQEIVLNQERGRMEDHIFNPAIWPLFELTVIKVDQDTSMLLLGYDLLIVDGASVQIFIKDILYFYDNPQAEYKELEFTFRDYVLAYKEFKKSKYYKADREYWINKLAQFPPAPELRLSDNPANIETPQFSRLTKVFNTESWNKLQDLAQRHNITPSSLLCTAYAQILSFWSNQTKLAINLTVFNRYSFHPDINKMIGDFTSVILLEVDLGKGDTILERARQVQSTLMEALEHRHYEGVEYIREISKQNKMGTKAVMPIVFTSMLFNERSEEQKIEQIGKLKRGISQTSQVYLDHQASDIDGVLTLTWDYVDNLFDQKTIDLMFEQYTGIIERLIEDGQEYELTVDEDDLFIIESYNSTVEAIEPITLYGMFAEQVNKTPDHCAVKLGQESLSYCELDRQSDCVASYLKDNGIDRGVCVGISADRTIQTIVNMLGIVKAGGAYVPIDPEFPKERREYMLLQSGCKLFLTPDTYIDANLEIYNGQTIKNNNQTDDLAYIIYTSGSTGKPKGVAITHCAVTNTIIDINNKFSVTKSDRIIGLSSMCFDLSVYDIWGALSTGACLVLVEDQRDVQNLIEVLDREQITIWNSVPAIMSMLVDNLVERYNNSSLRLVMLSGDWIPVALPDKIRTHFHSSSVISLGGATEASIWSIYYPIAEIDKAWTSIPYGYPLANQQMYILGADLNYCPIGVPGEIYIGGRGVAREYYNDEQKTALAFLDHPKFGRIYKTGDYGVLNRDGTMKFLGRRDQQIKVRGYRIEIGEIESNLEDYQGIRNCAVILHKDKNGAQWLCAFYTSEDTISTEALISHLKKQLPDYMIPQYFIKVDSLTLTDNGKIDRNSLEQLVDIQPRQTEHIEARNRTEEALVKICEEVMGVNGIGVTDNFFDYGLNSIVMVQIVTRIGRELNIGISLKDFISTNNISELAELIEQSSSKLNEVVIYEQRTGNPSAIHIPFPMTEVQMAYIMGRSDVFELGGTSTHGFFEVETTLDIKRLNEALQKVIVRHPMLRAVFRSNEQRILDYNPQYRIDIVDATELDVYEQEQILMQERERMGHHVFNPEQWPLFEINAVKVSDEKSMLLMGYDLLIIDGASIHIFIRDLLHYYHHPKEPFKELEFTFRDYLLAYKDFKNTKYYKADRDYWLNKLEEFPSAPELPLNGSPSNIGTPHFSRLSKIYDHDSWKILQKRAQEQNITPSALLCTAYAQVLSFHSNQTRVAINLTVFNRYPFHVDINKIVGDFTSVILLDVDFNQGGSILEKARAVQITLMEALEHRHYEGVEYIREISKQNNMGTKAVMPIVFTSMLFNEREDLHQMQNQIGILKKGISQTSQVYLDHQASDMNGVLTLNWDYVDNLLEPHMVQQMFEQYTGILDSLIVGNEDYTLSVSAEDREIIEKYNMTEEDITPTTLYDLFTVQVAKTPDKIAVKLNGDSLTYRELDQQSDCVAVYLKGKGIENQDNIGILADRKIRTIVNMVGIVKAGGSYVPIDPEHPEERRNYMLEAAGCKLLLTPELFDTENMITYVDKKPENNSKPKDRAYIIYTSGSTGKPKGVAIAHGAVTNTIIDINRKFNVCEKDKIIGLSSMCFDLSVYDIWGALSSGACLVMVEDQRDVTQLIEVLDTEQITIWNSVPAIMGMTIDNIPNAYSNQSLRLILMSGDWIPVNLPSKINNCFKNSLSVSLGGATEASIWSIYYPITEVDDKWTSIPYGLPLANQKMYVLNTELQYCPIDVPGELYIGGAGVAQEYYNDDEKTSCAFIQHPKLGYIYKTGDYGVITKDRYIKFLGRRDQQIKVRGYRIEIGEIESNIEEYEGIKKCAVILHKDEAGSQWLCAFYTSDKEIFAEELTAHLKKQLPDYMVPQYFTRIDEIALTANGKIDRKKLINLIDIKPVKSEHIGARNETEEALVVICREIMGIDSLGVTDNFFDYGLNSIIMVQIVTRIGRELNVAISFKEFISINNIVELAELITGSTPKADEIVIYEHKRADMEHIYVPFPVTEVQMAYLMGRSNVFELGGTSTHGYFELETHLDIRRLNVALQKLIARHPMLRTVFGTDRQYILEYIPEYKIAILDARTMTSEEQQEILQKERQRMGHHVFDPEKWPLFEINAIQFNDNTSMVVMGYDLLILDGASIQIFIKDLLHFYNHPDEPYKELEFTFRDYMLAYKEFKESKFYKADRDYWMNQIEDFPSAPELLLTDNPSNIKSPHFSRVTKIFDHDSWKKLQNKAQEHNITPSALLCTAYAQMLAFWSNQPRMAINLTVFNRYPFHPDIEKIIGDFTSVILLDVDLRKGNCFMERAEYVQSTLMEALEHRHYEGVEYIREFSKRNNMGTQAVMPIVFTSMLFNERVDTSNIKEQIGDFKTGISQTSQVYLDHQASDTDGVLTLTWDYVDNLLDSEMVGLMFEQYTGILESLIEEQEEYILSAGEEDLALVQQYNKTEEKFELLPLHHLFIRQAKKNPDRIAVESEDNTLTYGELDIRSDQVACYLKEKGLLIGNCVGVMADRTIETIVNMIGILKAGGAYVPVDPSYPSDRREYILSQSGSSILLTPDSFKTEQMALYSGQISEYQNSLDSLAYVIYTSGSTGRPKGVSISHREAVNTIIDINRKFTVSDSDRILGISSMCFDLSVYDIFGALEAGATLVMIPDIRDMGNLVRVLEEEKITIWNSVPAIMDLCVDYIEGREIDQNSWSSELQQETITNKEEFCEPKYRWSPAVFWNQRNQTVFIEGYQCPEFATDIFPEFYFITQQGIQRSQLMKTFSKVNQTQLNSFLDNLIEKRVLVDSILPLSEVFKKQGELFDNKYEEAILYDSEKYEKFKYEQLGRSVSRLEEDGINLSSNVEYPSFISKRVSHRDYAMDQKITREQMSKLFNTLKQNRKDGKITYYYPCAGGLYPIDVYVYIKKNRVEGFKEGLYYYNPVNNRFHMVAAGDIITVDSHYYTNKAIFKASAFSVFLIYNAEATMPKYGGKGYLYSLIDSGIMVSLLNSVAEMLGIGMCSIGDMMFGRIEKYFKLNKNQVWIHTIEGGLKLEQAEANSNSNYITVDHTKEEYDIMSENSTVEVETLKEWDSEVAATVSEHRRKTDWNFSEGGYLRHVLLSGDWIPLSLPNKIQKHFNNAEIYSLGGATEGSIWSIYYPVKEVKSEWKSIPYGIPLANQKIYILDFEMRICPVGVQGEIYIGGIGVADGYRNDKEKTRQVFINHPTLGRIYKTGDFGVLRKNGYVDFLGRKDTQVKVGGHRIEIGEIESCLLKFDYIRGAVVIDQEEEGRKKYLCAYIVTEGEVNTSQIRKELLDKLPHYMIPAYFVPIESIPLTSNGKVNRKMLPRPSMEQREDDIYVMPRTSIELQLINIWKEVLGVTRIGIDNNFFEIGGDSLLLMKAHNMLEKEFPGKIKVANLFNNPTISSLAQHLHSKYVDREMKKMKLEPVLLLDGYMAEAELEVDNTGYSVHRVSLELSLREKIDIVKEALLVETDDIITGAYLFVIAKIIEKEAFTVHTMLHRPDTLMVLNVNLSNIESFDELILLAFKLQIEGTEKIDISINGISMDTAYSENEVLPLLYRNDKLAREIDIMKCFDLVFELEENSEEITVIFHYNTFKINQERTEEISNLFLNVLELMISDQEESDY